MFLSALEVWQIKDHVSRPQQGQVHARAHAATARLVFGVHLNSNARAVSEAQASAFFHRLCAEPAAGASVSPKARRAAAR